MVSTAEQKNILLESGTNELEILVFTLGGQRFGANVAKVREVIEPLSVAALPQAQPSVLGMFQLRERVIPLIDLQRSLGKPPIADLTVGKIVIMEFNGVRTGFQVDTVEQIYRVNWEDVAAVPDLEGVHDTPLTSIAHIEGGMVLMIDFERIMFEVSGVDLFAMNAQQDDMVEIRSHRRILFAEDSRSMRTLIQRNLADAGYTDVTTCVDGLEAWEHLERELAEFGKPRFDLLITDIEMPRIDGLHLCRRIKENAQMRQLPVVIFSSLVSIDNEKKCRAVGAEAQISKPRLDQLVQLIDEVIERNPAAVPAPTPA